MSLNLNQLRRSYREGKLAAVRKTLWSHVDSGRKLNPDGYGLLLATYERGKPDARLAGLLDDRVALLDKPGGNKLLYRGGHALAALLAQARRWGDAMRQIEGHFEVDKGLSLGMHALLFEVARRVGPEAQARALALHDRIVKREPGALDLHKIVRAAKKARETVKKAKLTSKAAIPSTADELQQLIDGIAAAGGKACGWDGERFARPRGLSPGDLAKLALPGGKKLPPTIARWLAFDASWLPLFRAAGRRREWNAVALRDVYPDDMPEGLKPGAQVVVLPASANQDTLLVLDKLGKGGEAPVYGRDKEELFAKYPSFGEFLIDYLTPAKSQRRQ